MQYIPKVKVPAGALVVADLGKDRIDGQIAATVLQGIVNRDREEKIYVLNTYCADNRGNWQIPRQKEPGRNMVQVAEQWLDEVYGDLPQSRLMPTADGDYPMFLALLEKYRSVVQGVIIYDMNLPDATIEAATTIAGQRDAVVVSPMLYERIADYGFEILEDLRAYCFASNVQVLGWLKENYFAGANREVGFTWSHMDLSQESWGAANRDYVVANRLFTYYLDIGDEEERVHYGDIVFEYPAGTPVLGWTDELVADAMFARMGYFMIPFISVENMSVASSFPTVKLDREPVREPAPEDKTENTVYVAFHVADGDNLEHSLVYEPWTIRNDPAFGRIPATWILNPAMAELAPRALQWYRKVLPQAGQELAAMVGDGSPSSERYTSFHYYCEYVKHFLDLAGMSTMKQMLDAEPVAWNVKPDVVIGGYAGRDERGIGPYEYHMDQDTFHIGSIPLGEVDVRELIEKAPKDRPLILSFFSGTAGQQVCSRIEAYAKKWQEQMPEKHFVFVTASRAAAVYREFVRKGDGDEG